MNFARVLEVVSAFLDEKGYRYALIDRREVQGYFDRHGLKERFDELEKNR